MAQGPDWKQLLDAGAQFVALTRAEAGRRAQELVAQGKLAQDQVQGFVDDLVAESRRRADELLEVVRGEIQRQVKTLGIATKDDLTRLEARLTGTPAKPAAGRAARGAKKPRPRAAPKPARKAATQPTPRTAEAAKRAAGS